MTDDADPGREPDDAVSPDAVSPSALPRSSGAPRSEALGLESLGLEADDDPTLFTTTARQKVLGSALGLAGLAAFVTLGVGAVAGVGALSWLWSYLLLSLGGS